MYRDANDRRFQRFALIVLVIFAVICAAPFVLMLSASLTSESALALDGYRFWPKELSTVSFQYLWQKRDTLFRCYAITFAVTIIGTILNVAITSLMAYPLSRENFRYKNLFSFFVFFTMIFNGGSTAWYIVWSSFFHIKNTYWAMLLPNLLMSSFNVLLVRNYYVSSIPGAILEAAKIDGASEFQIFTHVVVPLSLPVTATVALFSSLAYWNDWINGMYFISKPELNNINVYLTKLMNNIEMLKNSTNLTQGMSMAALELPSVGIRMAIAIVAVVPILLVYPFLQKYLIKGVVIGAVKG
ncbi:MAG TPA: carbohydrate ABC transporter permease [Candidatus Faecousia intestinigallinarum]|nr:carbohydrate ABC transporter permease [Candidatus Faecousia intestinigallinarum]